MIKDFLDVISNVKPIYKGKYSISFYDKYPKSNIHFLVVPTKVYVDFIDFINNASSIEIQDLYFTLLESLKILNINDYTLSVNSGNLAEIKHLHVHVLA